MAKIPQKHQYRLAVMRYVNNSDLLPATMEVGCGGMEATIQADVNYLLPVFIIRQLTERYALQHKEIRGAGAKVGVLREFQTKRVRVSIEYELLPKEIEGHTAVLAFLEKLRDVETDEFKEFLSTDGESPSIDQDSLFLNPKVPITTLDFEGVKPKPESYFKAINEQSFARNPNEIVQTQSTGELEALKKVNSLLEEKLNTQGNQINELMAMMKANMAQSPQVVESVPEVAQDTSGLVELNPEEVLSEPENTDEVETTTDVVEEEILLTEEEKADLNETVNVEGDS